MVERVTAKDLEYRLENGDVLVGTVGTIRALLTDEGRVADRTRERYPLLRNARRTNMNGSSGMYVDGVEFRKSRKVVMYY